MLTRMEEIILLAVWRLQEDAYGLAVQEAIEAVLGHSVSAGTAYVPLGRLTKNGLLRSRIGAPTRQRGGRRKRFYELTPKGVQALSTAKAVHDAAWSGVSPGLLKPFAR